jgi:hypothetical protein
VVAITDSSFQEVARPGSDPDGAHAPGTHKRVMEQEHDRGLLLPHFCRVAGELGIFMVDFASGGLMP